MPEFPDVEVYRERLAAFVVGCTLESLRLASPFVLRSVDPAPAELEHRAVQSVRRLGKRIVLELRGECYVVIHRMIAGRLHCIHIPSARTEAGILRENDQ